MPSPEKTRTAPNAPTGRKPRPVDPTLSDVLDHIGDLTPAEIAKGSQGLVGSSTISNWRAGKVRTPLNYTLEGALRAAGFERVIRKIVKHRNKPTQPTAAEQRTRPWQ